MGLDTHMIAGSRACSTSTRPTNPTITNKTSQHYDEALLTGLRRRLVDLGHPKRLRRPIPLVDERLHHWHSGSRSHRLPSS